jgi:hypothetical protein
MFEREAIEALRALGIARSPARGGTERAWAAMVRRLVDGPRPLDIDPKRDVLRIRRRATVLGMVTVAAVVVGLVSGWLEARVVPAERQAPHAGEPGSLVEPAPVLAPTARTQPTPLTGAAVD